MITNTFVLDRRYPECTLTTYIHEPYAELQIPFRRAFIVCPGGGYEALSDRESECIALKFLGYGFNVFVLRYSLGEKAKDYAPLIESALAVKHVREHFEEYHIDPKYVFIGGFSAGGHLSASCGTLWNIPEVKASLGDCAEGINRPTGTVLCYPVISAGKMGHYGSIQAIAGKRGKELSDEDRQKFSLELHVDKTTSPAFIWHTFNDNLVPIQNSLVYASALAEAGVPFELHVWPDGPHGLALADKETWVNLPQYDHPEIVEWTDQASRWMKEFKVY